MSTVIIKFEGKVGSEKTTLSNFIELLLSVRGYKIERVDDTLIVYDVRKKAKS